MPSGRRSKIGVPSSSSKSWIFRGRAVEHATSVDDLEAVLTGGRPERFTTYSWIATPFRLLHVPSDAPDTPYVALLLRIKGRHHRRGLAAVAAQKLAPMLGAGPTSELANTTPRSTASAFTLAVVVRHVRQMVTNFAYGKSGR
jgi:hypothetical protein